VTGVTGPTGPTLVGTIAQSGDNTFTHSANADASSGDAIGGGVLGIAGGGGTIDVVTSNRTSNGTIQSGNATFENLVTGEVGGLIVFGPLGPLIP